MPTATVLQNKTTYFRSFLKIVLRTVRWSSGRATRGLDHSLRGCPRVQRPIANESITHAVLGSTRGFIWECACWRPVGLQLDFESILMQLGDTCGNPPK